MKLSHTKPQWHLRGQLPYHLFFIHLTTLIPKKGEIQFARTFTLPRFHDITTFYLIKTISKTKNQNPTRMAFQQIEKLLLNSVFFKDSSIQVLKEIVLEDFIILIHQIIKSLYFPLTELLD